MQGNFEGKKHAIRQTQDGWVVSFVVHPNDMTPEFAASPLGTRLMIGYAEIGEDEQPKTAKVVDLSKSLRGKEAYAQKDAMEQAVARACILCKDIKFGLWASNQIPKGVPGLGSPEAWLRWKLGIKSRNEISGDLRAYREFLAVEESFKQAIGLAAEVR